MIFPLGLFMVNTELCKGKCMVKPAHGLHAMQRFLAATCFPKVQIHKCYAWVMTRSQCLVTIDH